MYIYTSIFLKHEMQCACIFDFLDTLTESDARQKVAHPNRGPKGLSFGWVVDQYMTSLSSKH